MQRVVEAKRRRNEENNTCEACFLGGVVVALEIACEMVTNMDIEGKGCVESTANMEVGFCTGGPCLSSTHLMDLASSVPTLEHSSLRHCVHFGDFSITDLVAPDQI